jgi:hypothetical protein
MHFDLGLNSKTSRIVIWDTSPFQFPPYGGQNQYLQRVEIPIVIC